MKRISRRNLLQFAASTAIFTSMGARSGLAQSRPKGTIKAISSATWTEQETKTFLNDSFQKMNSDFGIEVERIPFNQIFQTLEVRLGTRTPDPDVYLVDSPLTASYAARGHLLALDGLFDTKLCTPSVIAASTYKGQVFSAPFGNTATVMYVNKALFERAGVKPPPTDPAKRWTWEETFEAAKAISRPDAGIWGLAFEQSERPYMLLPLGNSLGGQGLSPDGMRSAGFIDADPFVTGLTFLQKFYVEKAAPAGQFDPNTVRELFLTGKVGMLLGLTATYDAVLKSNLNHGVSAFPYFKAGKPATPMGGWTWGINPRSANLDGAKAFIKSVMTSDFQETYIRTRPVPPALTSQWDKMADFFRGDLWGIVRHDYENNSVPRPATPGFREYEDILRSALRDIQLGSEVKPTLVAAAAKIDRELRKYG